MQLDKTGMVVEEVEVGVVVAEVEMSTMGAVAAS
jgi:hypothetical protein